MNSSCVFRYYIKQKYVEVLKVVGSLCFCLVLSFELYFRIGESFCETSSLPHCHLIVFGGGSDPFYSICCKVISSEIPKNKFSYFQWYQFEEACCFISTLQDSKDIVVVGHSWGGQTAVKVANKFSSKIKALVTLDPVGWRYPPLPNNGIMWLNVVPYFEKFSRNNIVAVLGRRWKELPGAKNISIICDHCAVDKMLDAEVSENNLIWDVFLPRPEVVTHRER